MSASFLRVDGTMYQENRLLDVRGLLCPLPLLKAKQAISQLSSGELLRVLATDASSQRDFKAWVQIAHHQLLQIDLVDGEYHYLICKA
jgi:TusA-related sulfurtransferase